MAPNFELSSAPQHLLSLGRVALGALVYADVSESGESRFALPATVLAIVLDFADGRLARARGTSSTTGRVVDNACDAAFLCLAFFSFADRIGWVPLLLLVLAFGSYGARALASTLRGWRFTPSPRGHWAGIVNSALALAAAADSGGYRAIPAVALDTVVVASLALNALALFDNVRLARVDSRGAAAR